MKKIIIKEEDLKTLLESYMIWGYMTNQSSMARPEFTIKEVRELAVKMDFTIEIKEE